MVGDDTEPDARRERLRRLGELLEQARGRQGWPTTQAKENVGVSRAQWFALIRGQVDRPQAKTLAAIEQRFGWPPGSISDYLTDQGEEPSPSGVVAILAGVGSSEVLALLRRELTADETGQLSAEVLRILAEAQDRRSTT